jgi:hypothetical protein
MESRGFCLFLKGGGYGFEDVEGPPEGLQSLDIAVFDQ